MFKGARPEKTGDPLDLSHASAYSACCAAVAVAYLVTKVAHTQKHVVFAATIGTGVALMIKSTRAGMGFHHVVLWRGSAMFVAMWGLSLLYGTLWNEHDMFLLGTSEICASVGALIGVASLVANPVRETYAIRRDSDLSVANLWVVLSAVVFLMPVNVTPTLDTSELTMRYILFASLFYLELYACVLWRRPFQWQYQWATTVWVTSTGRYTMMICLIPLVHQLVWMNKYRTERHDESRRWDPATVASLPSLSFAAPTPPKSAAAPVEQITPRSRQTVKSVDPISLSVAQAVMDQKNAPPVAQPPVVKTETERMRAALRDIPFDVYVLPRGVADVKTLITSQATHRIVSSTPRPRVAQKQPPLEPLITFPLKPKQPVVDPLPPAQPVADPLPPTVVDQAPPPAVEPEAPIRKRSTLPIALLDDDE